MNPYLEVILATSIWGFNGLLVKWADIPSTQFAFFRMSIPFVLMFLYLKWKKSKIEISRILLAASILNAIRTLLYFVSMNNTSIGNAVILAYTWPIFVGIWSVLILHEHISKKKVLLMLTAFAGVAIMFLNQEFSFGSDDFIGMVSMIAHSLIYALVVVLFKKDSHKHSRTQLLFYQNMAGAFIFLPFAFAPLTLPQAGLAATHAIGMGILGFGLFFSALKRIPASTASLLTYMEVFFAILYSSVILGETITMNMILGGMMIVASAIMITRLNAHR